MTVDVGNKRTEVEPVDGDAGWKVNKIGTQNALVGGFTRLFCGRKELPQKSVTVACWNQRGRQEEPSGNQRWF